jgi:hypothetical protein
MTKTRAPIQELTHRQLLGAFARGGVEKMAEREHILNSNGEHTNQLDDLPVRDNQAANVVGGIDTVPLPESPVSTFYTRDSLVSTFSIGTWPTPESPYVNRVSYTPLPWPSSYNILRF